MPEPRFEDLSRAMKATQLKALNLLLPAIVDRKLADGVASAPIVLEASRPGLGAVDLLNRIGHLLETHVFVEDAGDVEEGVDMRKDAADFVRRLRLDYDILVIGSWQKNPENARQVLLGMLDARKPHQIVVVHGIDASGGEIAGDVAATIGDLAGGMTVIPMTAPEILDDEALKRLGRNRSD